MSIRKFRLSWKGGSAEQMDVFQHISQTLDNVLIELQSMSGTLVSIDNGVQQTNNKLDQTNIKLDATNVKLDSQLLLSQQIADNTSCACNALGDVNDKLDDIIEILEGDTPVPATYKFELHASSNPYTITDEDLSRGYFEIDGESLKNGVLFNDLTVDAAATFIIFCNAMSGGIIRIGISETAVIGGIDITVTITQGESNIEQDLQVIYVAAPSIPDEFRIMAQPSQVDYLDTRTEMTLDVVSYYGGVMVLPAIDANWQITSIEVVPFGTEGKSMYRLKVKTKQITSFDQLLAIPLKIEVSNSVGSATVDFQISKPQIGIGLDRFSTSYVSPSGVKGWDPLTYTNIISFFVVQNIESFLDGGVFDVDWHLLSSNDGLIAFVGDLSQNTVGVVNIGSSPLEFISGGGYWSSTVIENNLKFVVNREYDELNLPVKVTYPSGINLIGGGVVPAGTVDYKIPLAPCPPVVASDVVVTWPADIGLIPDFYTGDRIIGDTIPIDPPMQDSQEFRFAMGYRSTPLVLDSNIHSWCMHLSAGVGGITGSYESYLIVDRLACYSKVKITG